MEVFSQEQYEDVFSFSNQLTPLDHFSARCWYGVWDFQLEFGFQEADDTRHLSFAGYVFNISDPKLRSLSRVLSAIHLVNSGFGMKKLRALILISKNYYQLKYVIYQKKDTDDRRSKIMEVIKNIVKRDNFAVLYLPIAEAAKKMNVGLTLLKRSCRNLGIPRWPRRKLISLETLIQNVKQMEEEGGEEKMKNAITILEQEKKRMEEIPAMELENKTKRLRQACSKANYKKRKLMDTCSESGSISNNAVKVDEITAKISWFHAGR